MQSNKKKQPSSKLKSFYLSCRSHLPCSNSSSTSTKLVVSPFPISKKLSIPYIHHKRSSAKFPSSITVDHRNETVEMHWKRVHELETELMKVETWICSELARLKSHLRNNNTIHKGPCCFKVDGDQRGVIKFERLDGNGGYLYSLNGKNVFHGVCQDLVVQISSPSLVPPDIGSDTSKVLNQMAAMGKENLISWLLQSMPMTDISTDKTHKLTKSPFRTPNGLLEAILLNAVKRLGKLVIEGLRIQMGVKEVIKKQQDMGRRRSENGEEKIEDHTNGGAVIIMAMLIQPRDPEKGYEPMNEMMIGFVEAVKNEEDDEQSGFVVKGVHVAGLVARKRDGQVINNCLWYVSA